MFVIKYSCKGKPTKYFTENKLISTLKSATAFGESFREQFQDACTGHMSLKTINVSEMAEIMYKDKYIKVKDIVW